MNLVLFQAWVSALLAGVLSFASPKESSQRKGDPEGGDPEGGAPAGFLALLETPGGWRNSPAAQTTPADCPRHSCVAQRLPRGPERRPRLTDTSQKTGFHGQPGKMPKFEIPTLIMDALPGPLRGAEQRRSAGGSRRALFEGRSPELRSRPAFRVAQGTGAAGTDPGVAFSLATFFWRSKRKYARQQGGNPSQSVSPSQSKPPARRNPAVAQNPSKGESA